MLRDERKRNQDRWPKEQTGDTGMNKRQRTCMKSGEGTKRSGERSRGERGQQEPAGGLQEGKQNRTQQASAASTSPSSSLSLSDGTLTED